MFNPFKYRYTATFLQEEGENALLQVDNGHGIQNIHMPKSFLPKELTPGQEFIITLQPQETAKKDESAVLKELLQELIN